MTERTPWAAQSSIIPTTTRAGTTKTTRSRFRGRSTIDGTQGTPQTVSYLGLTGYRAPVYPTWRSERSISGAQESDASDAPTTAIDRGASSGPSRHRDVILHPRGTSRPAMRSPPSAPVPG